MGEKAIFKYIKKLLPFIVIFCIVATVLVSMFFQRQRTYTASAVINYNFDSAESGKTPSGDPLDVNEIKSSSIMSKVIDQLGLQGSYSVDNLTSRISITAVPDEDKEAQKQAMLEEGTTFVYVPTTYIISFTASNGEGVEFARTMLDEIVDTYFSVFGENYINEDYISNKLDKIYEDDYDYIEMMEYIDKCIDDTTNSLYQRISSHPYYRSTETEMSFDDLVDRFNYLKAVKVSDLFSKIYNYQVTKSKDFLVSDYETRIDDNHIVSQNELEMLRDVNEVIDIYVKKMHDSGNTNITFEYILEDIYEHEIVNGNGQVITKDQTVTYDELIYAWRNHSRNDKIAVIDSAYCQFVLDTFQKCTGKCNDGECLHSSKTCTQLSNANYEKIEEDISNSINGLVDDLTDLYTLTLKTNDEFNEFLGCKNIEVLSTVSTAASIDVKTYSIIAFVFFMIICCGGATLLGRLNDIINASFYTDPKTKFNNRAYFDKYLKKTSRHSLDDGSATVSLMITNQREINDQFGRDVGDKVIKLMADELRSVFARMNAQFIYNGNSHYVILLEKTDSITAEDALSMLKVSLDEREQFGEVTIRYKAGVAETFRDEIRSARVLLVKAIGNSKEFVSEANVESNNHPQAE